MFEARSVPTSAKLAGVLLLLGMALNGIIVANRSAAAGTNVDASFRLVPAAIWGVALVLAIVAIVRFRGRGRLWPAYTTLVVIALAVLAVVPATLLGRERVSSGRDGTAAGRELATRNAAFGRVVEACFAAHPNGCSARDLATTPGADRFHVRLDRDCSVALDFCLDDRVDGGLHFEQVSRAVRGVGLLRIATDYTTTGRVDAECHSLRTDPNPALEQAACGLGPTGSQSFTAEQAAQLAPPG
ncbi:MAG: hypothetical protein JWN72_2118 [Thermoleophilia bacterium]|nr:hypothetical protein [Thermoleophilia bacterium]